MKYCEVIIDGASGLPLPQRNDKTCLELAKTPNLDAMVKEGVLGMVRTVPVGMEPSSACACMSIMGYDPRIYYKGRAAIEAVSMGIPIDKDEVVFRCNLVAVKDGKMWDYSSGHINTDESLQLISSINQALGDENTIFYPGVSYRHICKLKGQENVLNAECTPPHDIPEMAVENYFPHGAESERLLELMQRSKEVLNNHPVNIAREARGDIPATMIWLFWGSGPAPEIPAFRQVYGLNAALTSGVDLLQGLAKMTAVDVLKIPGVTDGPDNDYVAQVCGALDALENHDMVIIHVEAADEAGHAGNIDSKVKAIELTDKEVIGRLRSERVGSTRLLILPDHPTPITVRTHIAEPVPFMLWGPGLTTNRAKRFTEAEAGKTDFFIEDGYNIISKFLTQLNS